MKQLNLLNAINDTNAEARKAAVTSLVLLNFALEILINIIQWLRHQLNKEDF